MWAGRLLNDFVWVSIFDNRFFSSPVRSFDDFAQLMRSREIDTRIIIATNCLQ